MAGNIELYGNSKLGGFQRAYEESATIAYQKLAEMDIKEICRVSGAVMEAETILTLVYIGETYQIDLAQRQITGRAGPPEIYDRLIMLHYLTVPRLIERQIKLITFKELPDGLSYYPTYMRRCVKPLIERFGDNPDDLTATGIKLGAVSIPRGDAGIHLRALPRININIVLWRGDEELPAEGTVYFSSDINDYLPTEDIAVLGQSIARKLITEAVINK